MNKRVFISIALVVALLLVIYFSVTAKRIHPPKEEWLVKHKEVVARNQNPDKFCLDCHYKKFGHTKENFCNKCHKESGVRPVK
ncbi:hypothetical protein Tfer_0095 [Thermincola ferriacetica]|uniref:Uncharacterized protein n=2 Tax=Thermincola TaxID=278993 RepID=D5XED6_THEPJ|nr:MULTISPECIES: hypothetical protein [Thermincola]ADG82007.1 conserved hypothetical protein [Thermincola potens JR]KNZ71025.1 hypothetical protein Tfer_0095 [Thermincola ferriacetica]